MYYVGCHWGTEDDGYICSSKRMTKAYRRRPNDFKRRVLSRVYTNREDLHIEEHKFLSLMESGELGNKYYNLRQHKYNHWAESGLNLNMREKISKNTKKAMWSPEVREKYLKGLETRENVGQRPEVREKRSNSMVKSWAERSPVELRHKPLPKGSEELIELYKQKSLEMWNTMDEEKKMERGKKISKSLQGKQNRLGQVNTPEHRRKISEAQKGVIHPRYKIEICGVEYDSPRCAVEHIGKSVGTINRRLNSHKYPEYIRKNKEVFRDDD